MRWSRCRDPSGVLRAAFPAAYRSWKFRHLQEHQSVMLSRTGIPAYQSLPFKMRKEWIYWKLLAHVLSAAVVKTFILRWSLWMRLLLLGGFLSSGLGFWKKPLQMPITLESHSQWTLMWKWKLSWLVLVSLSTSCFLSILVITNSEQEFGNEIYNFYIEEEEHKSPNLPVDCRAPVRMWGMYILCL